MFCRDHVLSTIGKIMKSSESNFNPHLHPMSKGSLPDENGKEMKAVGIILVELLCVSDHKRDAISYYYCSTILLYYPNKLLYCYSKGENILRRFEHLQKSHTRAEDWGAAQLVVLA